MNNSDEPVSKRNFWTKNYWRSALIAFVIAGTLSQMRADNPEMSNSLVVMAVTHLVNIAMFLFLGAAVLRLIRSRATRKKQ